MAAHSLLPCTATCLDRTHAKPRSVFLQSVETLACDDPRLEAYHLACPSRLKPAVAREVRAAGSAPSPRSSAGDTAAPPQPLRDSLSGLSADSQNDS